MIKTLRSTRACVLLAAALSFSLTTLAPGAENISPLGQKPDWSRFEKYQETMTRDEFVAALQDVYCTRGYRAEHIRVEAEAAQFLMEKETQQWFTLRFAASASARQKFTTSWARTDSLPKARPDRPLAGIKIALDPGHIGGRWAKMEERWFQVGDSRPIQEGDMTLRVAQLLAPKLRKLGATVSFVRARTEPTTPKRPDDLRELARQVLQHNGVAAPADDYQGAADPEKEHSVRWESELLFYRNSEIRQRAAIVNARLKPDVVLCLHFNAEAWDDPAAPRLVDHNHLHLLVNGAYLPAELDFDDVRFEMLERLLSRTHAVELPLALRSATALAQRTGLPPYQYTTDNVTKVAGSEYVFLRNLMATRLYDCPVIYYEPYVMNSDEVFWRVQEGDYEGLRNVNGTERPSIFREYADGVAEGLAEYYRAARP